MLEPLGVAIHAVDLARPRLLERVALLGCGPIGLLILQVLRAAGAGEILAVDPQEHRRDMAARLGATRAGSTVADIRAWTGNEGATLVIEATNSPSGFADAVLAARIGGRVVLVGIPDGDNYVLPASEARRRALKIKFARRMGDVYPRAIALVAAGKVNVEIDGHASFRVGRCRHRLCPPRGQYARNGEKPDLSKRPSDRSGVTTRSLLLAVDVGTRSARAGLFTAQGALLQAAAAEFELLHPAPGHAVYRMDEIWAAVRTALRVVLEPIPDAAARVAAIAFDATSSLVLNHAGPPPLAGDADVFCWMDHRAEVEAAEITATGDRLLDSMGGTLSPEMHLPKLLWLQRHDRAAWERVTDVHDLCDELARRATGVSRHSLCGLACKWAYSPEDLDGDGDGWRRALLQRLAIPDLLEKGCLADPPRPVGSVHGGLAAPLAAELALAAGIPVAVGLIDAAAGAVGVLGADFAENMNGSAALIGGTSTCLIAFASSPRRITGVWGPFADAVLEGCWMHEAGQSLSGGALDAVLMRRPGETHDTATAAVLACLDAEGPAFAAARHMVPDWLGNRSPIGSGTSRALASGIGTDHDRRAMLETYYAIARALALQLRHIVEHMNAHGYAIARLVLSGGHRNNALLMRLYRDALGAELVVTDAPEPVLLGTAMVASVAAGWHTDLLAAMRAMSPKQSVLSPDPFWRQAHDIAYGSYRRLVEARSALEQDAARMAALVQT